ncbi:MAG: hypothetical protein RR202_05650 [Bacteroidales bacterium]
MTRLKGFKEEEARIDKRGYVDKMDTIKEEDEQHFREWLKQHKVDHPEDADKEDAELYKVFVRGHN